MFNLNRPKSLAAPANEIDLNAMRYAMLTTQIQKPAQTQLQPLGFLYEPQKRKNLSTTQGFLVDSSFGGVI